ncbi:MAG: hypothetical protein HRU19_19315 [Pseudobacteriovorax sp.]|nr:hypothetical protein [Pseudobacteriovorax sp.]
MDFTKVEDIFIQEYSRIYSRIPYGPDHSNLVEYVRNQFSSVRSWETSQTDINYASVTITKPAKTDPSKTIDHTSFAALQWDKSRGSDAFANLVHKTLSRDAVVEAIKIPWDAAAHLPIFSRYGFQPHYINLGCSVDKALSILPNLIEKANICFQDFNICSLTVEEEVDQIADIWLDEFGKNPQHCWYGKYPKALALLKTEWNQCLNPKPGSVPRLVFVIKKQGTVLGYFEGAVDKHCPRQAGVALVFSPVLQGKSIALLAYFHLLKHLKSIGVKAFLGTTANPKIIGLRKTLGSVPTEILLRKEDCYYPVEHFTKPFWREPQNVNMNREI